MTKHKKQISKSQFSNKPYSQTSPPKQQFTGELPYQLTNDFFFKVFLERNETALRGDDKDMILDVSDKFGIYMLQLNQLGNHKDEENIPNIYQWAQLFKARTWEEIQMLAQKNDAIQQSIHTLQELTADEEMRMKMEARERYRMDFEAAVDYQKQKIQQQLDALQAENVKKDEQLSQKDERIRILEDQIAKLSQK